MTGETSTELAVERTRLAHERTLMAWTRTATSLISFGFTIYKFFQYLRADDPELRADSYGPRGFALLMIGTGLIALLLATIEHRRNERRMRERYGPMPRSLAAVVAGLIAVVGIVGLVAVALNR